MTRIMLFGVLCAVAATASVQAAEEKMVELFPVVQGGKWGYMDKTGNLVIKPQYECAWDFSDGMACVQEGLLRGYINSNGTMVIKPQYVMAGPFSEGLAGVCLGGERWGDFVSFNYGKGWRWGYIDKTGGVAITSSPWDPACSADEFHEGVSRMRTNNERKWQYMKKDGTTGSRYAGLGRMSEGMMAFCQGDGKWGFLDKTLKEVLKAEYEGAGDFSEGLAKVKKNKKWTFIDKTGRKAIEGEFENANDFSEGLAAVQIGTKWGCIDREGKKVIAAEFDYVARFSGGLARIVSAKKHGYVDKTGRKVIEPRFDCGWDFALGLARVAVGDNEGYIDKTGKYIWEPRESAYWSGSTAQSNK